jgi:RNA polymerase sigma-70 factor (ECF subfamily)
VDRHRRFDPDTYLSKRFNIECGPEASLSNQELRQEIEGSLDELSTDHRTVIVMKTLDELSYGEIGQATNQSESQVRGKLYRARKAFRSIIASKRGTKVGSAA